VQVVQERIAAAAQRAGRDSHQITLVAVTKTHPLEVLQQAIAAGVVHLGESRIQEAEPKISALHAQRSDLTWHMIGHLQRNKARASVGLFDLLHTVDSLRLAETLNRHYEQRIAEIAAAPEHSRLNVLLQVNVSGEATKEGFDLPGGVQNHAGLSRFLTDVERIVALPYLRVQGLMTIAPWQPDPEAARPVFRALRELRDHLATRWPQAEWSQLSMGMTDDLEVAIEEGATLVRVGRAIFGERA